jgi:hypothetical protein
MAEAEVARIKVTWQGIRPPIWRRLEVPLEFTLAKLSAVIVAAFGWTNSHLHEFEVGQRRIGLPGGGDWAALTRSSKRPAGASDLSGTLLPPALEDDAAVTLAQVLRSGEKRFLHVCDFGDDWRHLVQVEALLPADRAFAYPRCTAGRRSAPPEDCGGLWAYEHLLAVLADPDHADYAELRRWCPSVKPGEFDLVAADEAVRNAPEYWE